MVIVWMWGEIGGQNAMALAFKCLLCCVLLCVCVCVQKSWVTCVQYCGSRSFGLTNRDSLERGWCSKTSRVAYLDSILSAFGSKFSSKL